MIVALILILLFTILTLIQTNQVNKNKEPYLRDIIVSASYPVTIYGKNETDNAIEHGICSTFFINSYKIHYRNFETYALNSLKFIAMQNKLYMLENIANVPNKSIFTLEPQSILLIINSPYIKLDITKEELLAYASIKEYIVQRYHKGMLEATPVPNYKALIKGNLI